jgi:hypothetical protein
MKSSKPLTPLQKITVVGGTVFNDVNGNGVQVPGENGIVNARIYLRAISWTPNGFPYTLSKISTLTDNKGKYSFYSVTPWTYQVEASLNGDWTLTTPNIVEITVSRGSTNIVNFGVTRSKP